MASQAICLMQMPVVFPLCDCCNRLRRWNSAAHQHCPTLLYPAIAIFDLLPFAVKEKVTGFAAALTGAVVTNNTLELANGTCFLGSPALGSKQFIRPCY